MKLFRSRRPDRTQLQSSWSDMPDVQFAFGRAYAKEVDPDDPNVGPFMSLGAGWERLLMLQRTSGKEETEGSEDQEAQRTERVAEVNPTGDLMGIANIEELVKETGGPETIPLAVVSPDGSWDAIAAVTLDVYQDADGTKHSIAKINPLVLRSVVISYIEGSL